MWTNDGFVASFDAAGQYLWSGTYGGPGADGPEQIFPSANELCMLGYFTQTADLDLGPGVYNVAAQQGNDPFFACYDISGLALGSSERSGIEEPFAVYPNPANHTVYFKGLRPGAAFAVFNPLGARMPVPTTAPGIDVGLWPAGVYFLRAEGGAPVPFIIQH
jgi:hypothetical protein